MNIRTLLLPALALCLLSLGACRSPASNLPPSTDPNINKVFFTQVQGVDANTNDFTAGLVRANLANAPGQDFLTINASPSTSSQTRLVTVNLRALSDQIKQGASFPLGTATALGTANATYTESASIVLSKAYRATSGTLEIENVSSSINATTVAFRIKDAKMEATQPDLGTGTFVINLHGQPATE